MKTNRMAVIVAALTAVVLVGGIAWAASPAPDETRLAVDVANEAVVSAGEAGDVVLAVGSDLQVVEVHPSPGWVHEVEVRSGREVEVDFRSGERRIQFSAELEDGEVRVRVRERVAEGRAVAASTHSPGATSSTSTTAGTTPSAVSGEQMIVAAGPAGDVVLTVGARLEIVDVRPEPGWATEIEVAVGREVEVDFRSGERRIQFDAELEDGEVRVRVRDRVGDAESETETFLRLDGSSSTTSTASTSTTSTTQAGASAGSEVYSVPGVATVGISWADGRLTIASYALAPGWSAEIEDQSSTRVRIDFENGERDARFEARLDGSVVSVEIDGD